MASTKIAPMDDLTKPPAVDVKSSTDHSNKDPRLFNAGPINGRYMSLIPPSLNHPQPKTPQDRFKNAPRKDYKSPLGRV
ncbi:hypothetical protein MFRU_003g04350 [Monilinia fructicola]|nr:hypothetical protein MFRU_003g04350 [Monilinia fructicola]